MIFKRGKVKLAKTKKGIVNQSIVTKEINPTYVDAVYRYTSYIDPLFEKAANTSEFQFILTLIRFRGIQEPESDAYDNSLEVFDAIMDFKDRFQGDTRLNIFLWLYGHIVEASEPYEIIANLLDICNGGSYKAFNFPKVLTRWGNRNQYPNEKIAYLDKSAKQTGLEKVTIPIKEVFDRKLRNAVFHADYSVSNGEIYLVDPPTIYHREETLKLINKALAYHETIRNLIATYRSRYSESRKIKVSFSFSRDPKEKATLIVRKNHGVIAMKDSWSKRDIQAGKITWFIGKFLKYEKGLIDSGEVNLPANRIDFWNNILRKLPSFISRRIVKILERHFN